MKKLLSLLAIIAIVLASNCSKIPENNDVVIGIWSDIEVKKADQTAKQQTIRQEWIFNDAYLGRYHLITNGVITFKTDFEWSHEEDVYVISYPGTDMENHIVSMKASDGTETLADDQGNIMATRE